MSASEGDESHECPVCGDTFCKRCKLVSHFQSHDEDSKYCVFVNNTDTAIRSTRNGYDVECSVNGCNKLFKKKEERTKHLKKDHDLNLRQVCIEEAQNFKETHNRPPTCEDTDHFSVGADTIINKFGSWPQFLRDCSLEPPREAFSAEGIPTNEVLWELKYIAYTIGRTPRCCDYEEHYVNYSRASVIAVAGSWNTAVKRVGLNPNRYRTSSSEITEQVLLSEVKRLSDKLGRTPTRLDMTEYGMYGVSTYENWFGTWTKALDEAGITQTHVQYPDHLEHPVRSTWELETADILVDHSIDYEYENFVVPYGDDRTYTPDFVTENYVIEVKGAIYSNEKQKARAALEYLDGRDYVVVGSEEACEELPADHHIECNSRGEVEANESEIVNVITP